MCALCMQEAGGMGEAIGLLFVLERMVVFADFCLFFGVFGHLWASIVSFGVKVPINHLVLSQCNRK